MMSQTGTTDAHKTGAEIIAKGAKELAALLQRSDGTLVSLILRKKGVGRGPLGAPTVYNDDLVHVLLWTGFHYPELAEHSLKQLDAIWGSGTLGSDLTNDLRSSGYPEATTEDALTAIHELWGALKIAAGASDSRGVIQSEDEDNTPPPDERTSHFWTAYKVNGQIVNGVKAYIGEGNAADPRSPKPGALYISGVKLGEVILNEAPNGHWETERKVKTVAKNLLRKRLPVGRYARYHLDPDNLISFKVGKAASESARKGGVVIDPEAVRSLFKIAG
jgi:hypothetical protein